MKATRQYPLESIAPKHRHMNYWDMFATWVGANANNGTWFIGGVIAACGLWGGVSALIIGSSIAYVFLAIVGLIGYRTGITTTGLSRASFGIRGSVVPSIVNLVQFIGWTAVNTFIAATSISYICNTVFGWPVYGKPGGNWTLLFGIVVMSVLHLISVSAGQRSVQMIERIGMILVFAFVVWETFVVFKQTSFHQISQWQVPFKQKMSFGSALDALAAFNLAWVTAGADFTRFTNKRFVATSAPFWGALIGVLWFALVGLVATISIAVSSGTYDANNSDPSTIAAKLGLGILAMIVIILTSMTANAVNLQAAGSALNNMMPKISLKVALWIATIVATFVTMIPMVVGSFLDTFTAFLDILGMILGPWMSIMCVDYFILHRGHYSMDDLTNGDGPFWYRLGINWWAFACWILGVVVFLGLQKIEWFDQTVGAAYPAMVIVGIVYYIIMKIRSTMIH
ncbi:cytosine permease [Paucilactobacillus suebicus]|uniref:cytosine permease n=1 Tax=Paucilactobacillus suebicus TaxID=152335 RepID=UPI0002490AA7|nr:cytosine permease [Paucilactobacillus suebicus]